MPKPLRLLTALLLALPAPLALAQPADERPDQPDRPNILWLSCEDTSAYAFPAYGNTQVQTPNLDRLARDGIVFLNPSSVAPHCSPARATIIAGAFATTYGTDWHRQGWRVPADRYFFPTRLRDAGYFTTNNSKQDYNVARAQMQRWNDRVWSRQGNRATYNDDARGDAPFFSVFNAGFSHMTRVHTFTIQGRYEPRGPSPSEVILPPFVPDLPEMRSDLARELEGVIDLDRWVGQFLDDLDARGLADDTIIFF